MFCKDLEILQRPIFKFGRMTTFFGYAMLCYAMLCHAMPCHAMPCHAMLCYAMLCYANQMKAVAKDKSADVLCPSENYENLSWWFLGLNQIARN